MRILMLNYEFPPIGGGAGHAHQCLLLQFARRDDLFIDVVTSAPRPGLVKEAFSDRITLHRVGIHKRHLHLWRRTEVIEWLIKARGPYRRLLKENRYDLVHAFFGFPSGWLCYRTAAQCPYMISLRGSDVPGRNARLQLEYKILGPLLFKPIWRRAARIIACSEGLRRRALRFMPEAGIDVIPNGVDLEVFFPPEGDRICQPGQPWRLITVGRLSVTKRVTVLLDTVEILNRNGYAVELTVVGGGALQPSLEHYVRHKGLDAAVHLRGRLDPGQLPALYRASDIYVSASMQEGMSNAMLEAMASGLPIVTTACEGLEELIHENGLIIRQDNAQAMAEALQGLFADAETIRHMARTARTRAEGFNWDSTARQYLRCYQEIL